MTPPSLLSPKVSLHDLRTMTQMAFSRRVRQGPLRATAPVVFPQQREGHASELHLGMNPRPVGMLFFYVPAGRLVEQVIEFVFRTRFDGLPCERLGSGQVAITIDGVVRPSRCPLDVAIGQGCGQDQAKEHPFRVVKRQFGYQKVRFKGLLKNTAQIC